MDNGHGPDRFTDIEDRYHKAKEGSNDGVLAFYIRLEDVGYLLDSVAELKEFNSECEDRFKMVEGDRDYAHRERIRQRKRRRWALHELYMLREECRETETDCKYHYENAMRFKAEVGRLRAILSTNGISY